MAKKLIKLAAEQNLNATDKELRDCNSFSVGVLYTYENYSRDCKQIMELMEEIWQDYPDIKLEDMDIWQLGPEFSNAYRTCIRINIPVEQFICLRKKQNIQKL